MPPESEKQRHRSLLRFTPIPHCSGNWPAPHSPQHSRFDKIATDHCRKYIVSSLITPVIVLKTLSHLKLNIYVDIVSLVIDFLTSYFSSNLDTISFIPPWMHTSPSLYFKDSEISAPRLSHQWAVGSLNIPSWVPKQIPNPSWGISIRGHVLPSVCPLVPNFFIHRKVDL